MSRVEEFTLGPEGESKQAGNEFASFAPPGTGESKGQVDPDAIFAATDDKAIAKKAKKETTAVFDALKSKTKTPEEIKESQELQMKISRYLSSPRFQEYLESNGFKNTPAQLKGMSNDDLRELLTRIKCAIANKCDTDVVSNGFFVGTGILEAITQKEHIKPKLDLQGYSSYLQNNEQCMDALEQIRLENSIGTALSPYQRLMLSMAQGAVVVNATNQAAKRDAAAFKAKRAPQEEKKQEQPEESKRVAEEPLRFDNETEEVFREVTQKQPSTRQPP